MGDLTSFDVTLGGGVNLGGSLSVPVSGSLGIPLSGSVDVDANVSGSLGIPLSGGISVDLDKIEVGLDPLHINIDTLPKINIGLDPIRIIIDPLRCHLPVDMSVGFNLFGHDVACIRVCGEAQFIAEPYVPNPCECVPHKEGAKS